MFHKILYPTDFSDVSEKAMNYLKELRDSGASEVVVLHVMDVRSDEMLKFVTGDELLERIENTKKRQVEEAINKVGEKLKSWGFSVKTLIKKGVPFREILLVEDMEQVSIIVIGSHGMSNLEEVLMGSVSEKVIRKSKTPVFVVKR